jgi:hypothetical protein
LIRRILGSLKNIGGSRSACCESSCGTSCDSGCGC